jgi:hypothetical protein
MPRQGLLLHYADVAFLYAVCSKAAMNEGALVGILTCELLQAVPASFDVPCPKGLSNDEA